MRTAIGAAAVTFLLVLMFAGAQDVIAMVTGGSLVGIRAALRFFTVAAPLIGTLAYLICRRIMKRRRRQAVTESGGAP